MEETLNQNFDMYVLNPCTNEQAIEICKISEESTKKIIDVAAVNSPTQVTISGEQSSIEKAIEIAKSLGIRRPLKLQVGGPFHSRLMVPSAEKMRTFLEEIKWKEPKIPVISNVSAKPFTIEDIPKLLKEQIHSTVKFYQSMEYCRSSYGDPEIIELGPKPTLINLNKFSKTKFYGN